MLGKAKILLVWRQRNIESLACMDNSGTCSWHYLFFDSLKDIAAMRSIRNVNHQEQRKSVEVAGFSNHPGHTLPPKSQPSCHFWHGVSPWPALPARRSRSKKCAQCGYSGLPKHVARSCPNMSSECPETPGAALNQKCCHGVCAAFFFFLSLKPESQ